VEEKVGEAEILTTTLSIRRLVMRVPSTRFKEAIANQPPDAIIVRVSKLLGKKGKRLKAWAEGKSPTQLALVVRKAIDSGCSDEWEFMYFVLTNGNVSLYHTGDDPEVSKDTEEVEEEQITLPPLISHTHQIPGEYDELVNMLTEKMRVASATGIPCNLILKGCKESGKTTILNAILARLGTYGINTIDYRELSLIDGIPSRSSVVYMDNIDKWASSEKEQIGCSHLIRGRTFSFLATCTDTVPLADIIRENDIQVISIPAMSIESATSFLASYVIRGYVLHRDTAHTIIRLLTALRVSARISRAVDTAVLLLHDRIIRDVEQGVYPNPPEVIKIEMNNITRAIAESTGTTIETAVEQAEDFLRQRIEQRIIGQNDAVSQVINAVVPMLSGTTDPERPASVLMFVGPTGTGKTEMAKALADILCNGAFHKEDMNTYAEKHNVARIIGAPPGYTGFESPIPFMSFLDSHTRGVLLLDEIEKAHYEVSQFLMELFDTGLIRDAKGIEHSARGFIIILTSNVTFSSKGTASIGFGESPSVLTIREKVAKTKVFKPEVLGRISDIVEFKAFDLETVYAIAAEMYTNMRSRLYALGITSDNTDHAQHIKSIAEAYREEQGARSMKSVAETTVKNLLLKEFHREHHSH
jgi:DNA polymerase III delta prime subunit